MTFRKAGFTLVELMVVLAIIGILAGALTFQVTKAADSARAMRCKANLKNLSQAALNYGAENDYLPCAGSHEAQDRWHDGRRYVMAYFNQHAWVDWTGRFDGPARNPTPGKTACFYGQSSSRTDEGYISVSKGVLWSLTGGDLKTYICDQHKKICKRNGIKHVFRSYVMNAFFGYDYRPNGVRAAGWQSQKLTDLSNTGNASTRLLFAELPVYAPGGIYPHKEEVQKDYNGSGPCGADGVLETEIPDRRYTEVNKEYIGFNHLVGKRYVAHVSFADGHVEVLMEPRNASKEDLIELTKNLCNGEEIEADIRKRMR